MSLMTSIRAAAVSAVQKTYPGVVNPSQNMVSWRGKDFTLLWTAAPQIAKAKKEIPQSVAQKIAGEFQSEDADVSKVEKGMITLAIRVDAVARRLQGMALDPRFGVPLANPRKRVVIDFSSPNVAKELHVGHLRSTIIGESLARLQEHLGQDLLRLNHVGDWGTQFGMLITYLKENNIDIPSLNLSQLMDYYRASKKSFDAGATFEKGVAEVKARLEGKKLQVEEPEEEEEEEEDVQTKASKEGAILKLAEAVISRLGEEKGEESIRNILAEVMEQERNGLEFRKRSREAVVALQAGDAPSLEIWRQICKVSQDAYRAIYRDLNVTIEDRGESFYNPMLKGIVQDLLDRKIAERSNGAVCVHVEGFDHPFMIEKSDGGHTYDTTDLAALKHRVEQERAERIIYVVDEGQSAHFQQLEQTGIRAGYLNSEKTEFRHVGFGVVCGPDGKKYKTRSGEVALLKDLLQEAVDRAKSELEKRGIKSVESAKKLGLGALKYADLKNARQNNYTFSSDKMLDMKGDTAVYLQYALVRMKSVKEKVGGVSDTNVPFALNDEAEQALALHLLTYPDVLATMDEKLEPHHLAKFLYELAVKYTTFYTKCPIKDAPEKDSRLQLNHLTEQVLEQGLFLLGIESLEKM